VHVVGVRKVSVGEYAVVVTPSVARACQYQSTSVPRSRLSGQLVVGEPCGIPSAVKVRAASAGNVLVGHFNRLTVPTFPLAGALLTTSMSRVSSLFLPGLARPLWEP
jgi:hypothetical protein